MARRDDVYFAVLPREEIGERLTGLISSYATDSVVQAVRARQARAWSYYYGYSDLGWHGTDQVTRGGDQGELAVMRVNHSRSLAQALTSLITTQKYVWQPQAAGYDWASFQQTKKARAVLEHYQNNTQLGALLAQAVEDAVVLSEGYRLTEFDSLAGEEYLPGDDGEATLSGDFVFTNPLPWDVVRDPTKPSWDQLDWVIVRTLRSRWETAARCETPEDAQKVLDAPSPPAFGWQWGPGRPTSTWSPHDIEVFRFYHKRGAVLPDGRDITFLADGSVIGFHGLPRGVWPLIRIAPGEMKGLPFGYTPYFEILGLQEMFDSVYSSVATNLSTHGTQFVAIEEGSDPQFNVISSGGMAPIYYKPGSQPPQGLNLTKMPEGADGFLQNASTTMELLMGLNSVVRGQSPGDRASGSLAALLSAQAIQQAGTLQTNYLDALKDQGTLILNMIRAYANGALRISVAGNQRTTMPHEMDVEAADFDTVRRVNVTLGSPLEHTAQGRIETLQVAAQLNIPVTPDQFWQSLESGRPEPATDRLTEEGLLVMRENEMLSRGEKPTATRLDDHLRHGREHPVPLMNPSARTNPAVVQSVTDHFHEHYSLYFNVPLDLVPQDPMYTVRMLLLSGQQPPMIAPPMPGAPMPGAMDATQPPAPGEATETAPPGNPDAGAAKPPNMAKNAATGQEWNSQDGGGLPAPPPPA